MNKNIPRKIFLDANYLVSIYDSKRSLQIDLESLASKELYISSFSLLVLTYILNSKVPSSLVTEICSRYNIIEITPNIIQLGNLGPTSDLEDNIQLHSAVSSECSVFLTHDKKLLKLGIFGNFLIKSGLS